MASGATSGAAPSRKRPTLYDVAARANVSHQTVSRLVKGQTNIRPEIRARIEAAIEELHYRPNAVARSLATRRSHRIGALVYEMLEVGPSKTIQGASARAREAGYVLDIVSLDPNDGHAIEQAIGLLNQNELAGILVCAPTGEVIRAIESVQFAVPVYVDVEAKDSSPTLNDSGVRLCMDHLRELGHTVYAEIAGPGDWLAAQGRSLAYADAIRRHGLRSAGSFEGDWSAESGYRAGMRLRVDEGITAVLAANDQMALGAMTALQERGVRIPEDISVAGFDDIPESRYFRPALTTVHIDFDRQGRIAIDELLTRITGRKPSVRRGAGPAELCIRASSGPAPRR